MAESRSKKTKMLELAAREGQIECSLMDSLSEVEREAEGEPQHWAFKDILAHQAAWKEYFAQDIAKAERGEEIESNDAIDGINETLFEKYRHWTFPQVRDFCEQARNSLEEALLSLSEADLLESEKLPFLQGRPLWRHAIMDVYTHPIQHLTQIYFERGDLETVAALGHESGELLAGLDPEPGWQGLVRYNLACTSALTGQPEEAIRLLSEALKLSPGLTEWSKEDPDFASIREMKAYLALYG